MSKSPDPNQTAARVVRETIRRYEEPISADAEKAWETWIASIADVDGRTRALLRAAFEVGLESGKASR